MIDNVDSLNFVKVNLVDNSFYSKTIVIINSFNNNVEIIYAHHDLL